MGGDFFDAYLLPDGRLALTVADVSDKGISAALFMMNAKAVLKERALTLGGSPGEILTYAGNRLREENAMGLFVTVWMGCLDPETGARVTKTLSCSGRAGPVCWSPRSGNCPWD